MIEKEAIIIEDVSFSLGHEQSEVDLDRLAGRSS